MRPPRELPGLDPANRDAALRLTPVSRETEQRLDRLIDLLLARQAVLNLIAPSTIPSLWTRHVADSLQLLALAPEARTWIDLGSGGGFPGLVIACALADTVGARVHLVESIGKKAAFLRDTAEALGLPATVHCLRIEDFAALQPPPADVITARAVAPLPRLLCYVHPLLRAGSLALLSKGQDVEAELTEASKSWTIEADLVPSQTSRDSRIIVVRALAPVPTGFGERHGGRKTSARTPGRYPVRTESD